MQETKTETPGEPHEFLEVLRGFMELFEEMERKSEKKRVGFDRTSIASMTTDYGFNAKLGIEPRDLSRGYEKPRVSKERVEIKRIAVNVPGGRVEKNISLVNYKLEGALSKDGTLEIALERKR